MQDFTKAREYLINAEKIAREIGEKEVLRRVYVSLGELILAETVGRKAYSVERKAKTYAETALKLAEELNSKSGKAEVLLLQARIMVEQASLPETPLTPLNKGEFKEAGDKFKSAISIFEELKQPFEIAKAYYYYAQSIKTVGTGLVPVQFDDKSEEYLQKASELFEKIGAKAWLEKIEGDAGLSA